jgi:hypothetical protein
MQSQYQSPYLGYTVEQIRRFARKAFRDSEWCNELIRLIDEGDETTLDGTAQHMRSEGVPKRGAPRSC